MSELVIDKSVEWIMTHLLSSVVSLQFVVPVLTLAMTSVNSGV